MVFCFFSQGFTPNNSGSKYCGLDFSEITLFGEVDKSTAKPTGSISSVKLPL